MTNAQIDLNGDNSTEINQQNGIDEEEAELYDRQIRLWGLEAQNRMRRSSVLMINFTGITSESCKNIVLAGVGSITILDDQLVTVQDLGAGFFFRDDDIGKLRVVAGKNRINSLNPRVKVIGITENIENKLSDLNFLKRFDVVCLQDSNQLEISNLNTKCRQAGVPIFVSGSLGIDGYIFSDLINHNYLIDKDQISSNGEKERIQVKHSQKFINFDEMLKGQLNHITLRRIKKLSPILLGCLAVFEFQARHQGMLPIGPDDISTLIEISNEILKQKDLTQVPSLTTVLERLARSSGAEFVPTCAIIGSVLSQEVLNALGGKQHPLVNFFVFDGHRSAGDIYALGITRNQT
ncbi:hypothetical protein CROQUDRAFT_111731 [Cronartium quercuum f. sp. fusiforme G11]|uniref:Ubiquitin-like 1-activating enzyme E1A n=1 Tax=Cronartium quercuum f. sp. fusiforme G11 TaxID=708437 RepID=A0A9P6N4Z6_9BASI|nr:hypothetical protein CROQUDRAFT_111731 [Cronartium quercuum f. sp. fusiforme G11]